jgi:hypothetical protein
MGAVSPVGTTAMGWNVGHRWLCGKAWASVALGLKFELPPQPGTFNIQAVPNDGITGREGYFHYK